MSNNEQDQMSQDDAAADLPLEPASSDATIKQALESAFSERRLEITMELAGPRKELAYIYDRQTEESLTEWVPLTNDSAPVLLRTLDLLRDRVAEAFVQQAALTTASDAQQAVTAWSELRELLMVPGLLPEDEPKPDAAQDTIDAQEGAQQGHPQDEERIVITRAAIRELLLPGVRAQYLPELEPDVRSLASPQADPKPKAQRVLEEFTKKIVETQLTKIGTKLVTVLIPLGPVIAPALGILLELINPKEPPLTMADIEAEIDKRIKKALDKEYADHLKREFKACREAFNVRTQDIENDGNVGAPGDWNELRGATSRLQHFMFNNTGSRTYLSHQLLGDAMTMRLFALYGRIQAAKPNASVKEELDLLSECFNEWYKYLETLLDYGWNHAVAPPVNPTDAPRPIDSKDWGDFEISWVNKQFYVFDVHNCRDINNPSTPVRCRKGLSIITKDKPQLSLIRTMVHRKANVFTILNTTFRSLCQVYDAAVRNHNEQFGTTLPLATRTLFEERLGQTLYKATMNNLAKQNNLADTGGLYAFTWSPFRREGTYEKDNNDFLVEDLYVRIKSKSGKQRLYSVGDYPDLKLDGADAMEVAEMHFPRGFRAICYSEANFGRYLDDKGNVRYKGEHWVLPSDMTNPYLVTNGRKIRSMKIRIELEFWHGGSTFYGRIKDWQWSDKTVNPYQVADLALIDTP